jgi:hypothetical protein
MNATKTAKVTARYESGLLTAAEVANSLLYDLVCEPELDTAYLSSVASLPEAVSREFFCLLRRIQEADFHWTPFLLTSSPAHIDSTKYSGALQRICATLMVHL